MASGRTTSQLLLQMAIDATDQHVKEIYFVKNSSVKFYEKAYKKKKNQNFLSTCKCIPDFMKRYTQKKIKISSQLASAYQILWKGIPKKKKSSQFASAYQICWVSTRLVPYFWQSAAPKLGPLNPRSSNQGPIKSRGYHITKTMHKATCSLTPQASN